MTTVNGSTPNVTATTTKNTNEKHPVKNTLLGAGAGFISAGTVGYLTGPKEAKDVVELLTKYGITATEEAIGDSEKAFAKGLKAGRYGVIGAAIVGAIALAGTYLLGNKSEKAE